jgi:hypothetical protein
MIDYSKEGLVTDQTNVFWRVAGELAWQKYSINTVR